MHLPSTTFSQGGLREALARGEPKVRRGPGGEDLAVKPAERSVVPMKNKELQNSERSRGHSRGRKKEANRQRKEAAFASAGEARDEDRSGHAALGGRKKGLSVATPF